MKRLKKKNNPLWDRLLIENNMKRTRRSKENNTYHINIGATNIGFSDRVKECMDNYDKYIMKLRKENNMKTCKDCKYYTGYDTMTYCSIGTHNCIKNKNMKTKKQNILKAYKEATYQETKNTLKRLYPDVEFERKLAESWEEYCEIKDINKISFCYYYLPLYSHTEMNKAYTKFWGNGSNIPDKYVALRKLELLRDHYNDGWMADFSRSTDKYIIKLSENRLFKGTFNVGSSFLVFKTSKIRDKFLKNFKDLIEQAGDLI